VFVIYAVLNDGGGGEIQLMYNATYVRGCRRVYLFKLGTVSIIYTETDPESPCVSKIVNHLFVVNSPTSKERLCFLIFL
jgi:hypothetical protein